jgi:hypothetical protein
MATPTGILEPQEPDRILLPHEHRRQQHCRSIHGIYIERAVPAVDSSLRTIGTAPFSRTFASLPIVSGGRRCWRPVGTSTPAQR